MTIRGFHLVYNRLRLICAIFTCLAIGYAYSFSFDFELPSGEGLNREKNERDAQNREAYDRCNRGEGSSRDQERACEYEREHITNRAHD